VYKEGQLDVFMSLSHFPTLCVLQEPDGTTNHAVTIVGQWVFDSMLPCALPLTQAILDWSYSTDDTNSVQ